MADPVSLAINAALIAANMALTASQEFEGPRLDDLRVTTADYGTPLNYVWGTRRLDGVSCIWAEPLTEVRRQRKTKGGKYNEYTYYGTWAVALCDHEIENVLRIWFDRNLIYDATGAGPISPFADLGDITQYITIYLGTSTQEPDPRMAATVDAEFGDDSTPAYRGVAYIVFKDLPLEKLGNRLPQVSVEVSTGGAAAYPMAEREAALAASTVVSMSPDGRRSYWATLTGGGGTPVVLEIWDNQAASLMNSVEIADLQPNVSIAVDTAGRIYMVENDQGGFVILNADGVGQVAQYALSGIEMAVRTVDATLVERIIFTSWSTNVDGGVFEVGGVAASTIDTSALTGSSWQVKAAFNDSYGDVWLLGGAGDLATDELAVYRYVNASGRSGVDFNIVTMPISNGGASTNVAGFHCTDGSEDALIVRFGNGSGCVVKLDMDTLTILDQVVGDSSAAFGYVEANAVEPGSRYLWFEGKQWDFLNMEVVRTVHASSWDATFVSDQDLLYDRVSHALIRTSGAQDFQWLYLDRAAGAGVTLQSIVEDVCDRAGLSVAAGDIDATDLTQTITGYSTTQGTGKQWLEALLEAHDSEARPHDFTLEFLRRGVAVGSSIPVTAMGAGGGVRYNVPDFAETDLPLKVNLTFADVDRDQQPNTAIAQRSMSAVDSRRETSLDASTLAQDADTGRQMAEGYLRREWIRAQRYETTLTRAYSALEPGDAHELVLDDVTVNAKLKRLEFGANGVLTTEWERYAPNVHVATTLSGAPADGLTPDEVAVFGYTKGLALDIALVTDADEASAPFVYLAAAPYSDTPWPGATFYRSDDGTTYDEELGDVATSEVAVIGYALSALPDALATCWDNANSISVTLHSGELESSTKALVGNGANRALLGDEIIGFTTATLISTNTYQLSGLIRGRRGTEWATGTHEAGERFVLLDSLPKATIAASDVNANIYVRPTTNGGPDGFPQVLEPFSGAALKPYAPAHLTVTDSSGDKVVTWTRRTRTGGTWRDLQDVPLGEGSEAYIGRILDGSGNVIRTFSGLTSPTLTYTAAQIAADGSPAGVSVSVAQVSSTVGNGYFAEADL